MVDWEPCRIKMQKVKKFTLILVEVTKVAASIGTVAAAIMAWKTLDEMQIERNNAYRPEIVVAPNSFEGGMLKEDEIEPDKEYIYFDYNASDPGGCYSYSPIDNKSYAYIEKPYLTLKNIGQGTAKDIQVTFSIEWIKNSINVLTENSKDGYVYNAEGFRINDGEMLDVVCYAPNSSDPILLASDIVDKQYITYIASGEDTVNIALPVAWQQMLAVFFDQAFRSQCLNDASLKDSVFPIKSANDSFGMPDIVIDIKYSDLQGKRFEQQESIPWTGYLYYSRPESLPESKVSEIYLRTGFYEKYIR